MFAAIRNFILYLFGKRSEIQHLRLRDIVMAKAVLDIHRKRIGKEVVRVPIYSIHPIHRLDRENSMQAVQRRVAAVDDQRAPRERRQLGARRDDVPALGRQRRDEARP